MPETVPRNYNEVADLEDALGFPYNPTPVPKMPSTQEEFLDELHTRLKLTPIS